MLWGGKSFSLAGEVTVLVAVVLSNLSVERLLKRAGGVLQLSFQTIV